MRAYNAYDISLWLNYDQSGRLQLTTYTRGYNLMLTRTSKKNRGANHG